VEGVAFSPDGQLLATADEDGTVRLRDPATGQPVGDPLTADAGPKYGVNGVAFSPDGKLVAAADSDGTVRLRDPATGQLVGAPIPAGTSPGGGVEGVAFSPNGKHFATANYDGTAGLWETSIFADPYQALCTDAGPLTRSEWNQYAPGEPFPKMCI
jgi:WD40 repeat protein